jgi:alanine racemase
MNDHSQARAASVSRATRATVDLAALRHNVGVLAGAAAPAETWAVVKANAYGHGAVPCAKAALQGGAQGLCVALTQEAVELREAGIDAPILVLSEQPLDEVPLLVRHGVICTAYNSHYIEHLAREAERAARRALVHLKIDTGMHRVGAPPADAVSRAGMIVGASHLVLDGVMTHLATADDPSRAETQRQLDVFESVTSAVRGVAPGVRHVHHANSAAALRGLSSGRRSTSDRASRATLVRTGIALYGLSAGDGVEGLSRDLRPVMSLRTRVAHVQRVRAGEGVSYGLRTVLDRDTNLAVLPLGYADGIARRAWDSPARVLVGGVRRRIAGVVTMDQMMVDCGDDDVAVGDEAVLFGRQEDEQVSVEDWSRALGTITYEVVCAVSPRVPRDYVGGA